LCPITKGERKQSTRGKKLKKNYYFEEEEEVREEFRFKEFGQHSLQFQVNKTQGKTTMKYECFMFTKNLQSLFSSLLWK